MEENDSETGGGDLGSHWQEDWVLASVDSWVCSGRPKDDVVGKVMTSFSLKDLREAARRLQKGNWVTPNICVLGENSPDYSRKLAERIYDTMAALQNLVVAPVSFFVSASNLSKVPGAAFVDNLDEQAVSARLVGVDARLVEILERLDRTEHLAGTVTGLATSVTQLQVQLKEQQQAAPVHPGRQAPSWAEAVGRSLPAERGRLQQLSNGGSRARSASTKRAAENMTNDERPGSKQLRLGGQSQEVLRALAERGSHPAAPGSELSQDLELARNGFQSVGRRKRGGGIKKGASTVEAEAGKAAPFAVFISGTSPTCNGDQVKAKLIECAAAKADEESGEEKPELQVLKVEEIRLKIPEGEERRSRCWKVTVEPKFAEQMLKPESYPSVWGWRKWHWSRPQSPPGQQGELRALQGNTSAVDGRA